MPRLAIKRIIAISGGCLAVLAFLGAGPATARTATARPAPARKARAIAYVANMESGTVSRIDTATDRLLRPIRLARRSTPWVVAVTPDGKTAYVASYFNSTVTPFSTRTGRVGKPIKVPHLPDGLAITPDGKTLYVVSEMDDNDQVRGRVTPISTATNKAGRPVRVGFGPGPVVITPDSRTVYVATNGFNSQDGGGNVTVIRGDRVVRTIRMWEPLDIVLSPDGRTLYAATDADTAPGCFPPPVQAGPAGSLAALRRNAFGWTAPRRADGPSAAGTSAAQAKALLCGHLVPIPVATNRPGKPIPVTDPFQALMAPRGGTVYLLTQDDTVQAVSTRTRKIIWTTDVRRSAGVLVSAPGGRRLYLLGAPTGTHPGYVTPVSPATGGLGKRITVGPVPFAMAFVPGGRTGYVLCGPVWIHGDEIKFGAGSVVPVSTATDTAGRAIRVGWAPWFITIAR